jgi:hypothetical protein
MYVQSSFCYFIAVLLKVCFPNPENDPVENDLNCVVQRLPKAAGVEQNSLD